MAGLDGNPRPLPINVPPELSGQLVKPVEVEHDPFADGQGTRQAAQVLHDPFATPISGLTPQNKLEEWMDDWSKRKILSAEDIAGKYGQGIIHWLGYPGETLQGKHSIEEIRNSDIGPATALAVVTGKMPGVSALLSKQSLNPGATFGTMMGQRSETADIPKLNTAKAMADAGAHPEQILRETGWEQGADHRWMYEASDHTIRMNPNGIGGTVGKSLDGIEHLTDAYGNYVKDMRVEVDPNLGVSAVYVNKNGNTPGYIKVANKNLMDPTILMHEVQHGIQEFEGFAKGGRKGVMPAQPLDDAMQELSLEKIKLDEKDRMRMSTPEDDARRKELGALMKDWSTKRAAWNNAAYQNYRNLAGEQQAWNTERRLKMTPEERLEKPSWQTETVDRQDQIVNFASTRQTDVPVHSGIRVFPKTIPGYSLKGGQQPFDIIQVEHNPFDIQGSLTKRSGLAEAMFGLKKK